MFIMFCVMHSKKKIQTVSLVYFTVDVPVKCRPCNREFKWKCAFSKHDCKTNDKVTYIQNVYM